MNNRRSVIRTLCLILLSAVSVVGGEWSGYVAFEGRAYEDAPAYDAQDGGVGASVVFEPEFYQDWQDGYRAFEFSPYFRVDALDSERNLVDVRELSYLIVEDKWELKLGVSKVFWGVTESQHLVDVVNQTDLVANLDGEEKLGQPMAQFTHISDFGDLSFILMPYFRERTFPGADGRFRTPIAVDIDNPIYESSAEQTHLDTALRWFKIAGDFDIGFHYFRGTRRDPLLRMTMIDGEDVLVPYYEQMDQVGLDVQYTKGAWLLKLEAVAKDTSSEEFSAAVGGFEYTFYGIGDSVVDAGMLVEANLDSRGADSPNPFNKDIFAGTRLTWNDNADTSLVAGVIYDWEVNSVSTRLEYERRIGDSLKLEIELQRLSNLDEFDPLYAFRKDSYLQISLSKFF